jgi:hypothetical protein
MFEVGKVLAVIDGVATELGEILLDTELNHFMISVQIPVAKTFTFPKSGYVSEVFIVSSLGKVEFDPERLMINGWRSASEELTIQP